MDATNSNCKADAARKLAKQLRANPKSATRTAGVDLVQQAMSGTSDTSAVLAKLQQIKASMKPDASRQRGSAGTLVLMWLLIWVHSYVINAEIRGLGLKHGGKSCRSRHGLQISDLGVLVVVHCSNNMYQQRCMMLVTFNINICCRALQSS